MNEALLSAHFFELTGNALFNGLVLLKRVFSTRDFLHKSNTALFKFEKYKNQHLSTARFKDLATFKDLGRFRLSWQSFHAEKCESA